MNKKTIKIPTFSLNLSDLCETIIEQYDSRQNEDIEEWAEKLADDVSKLTD